MPAAHYFRRLVLAASVLPLFAPPRAAAAADEIAERTAAFGKAFRSTPKQPRSAEQRKEALALLAGLDAVPIAQALVEACGDLEEEVVATGERKQAIDDQIAALIQGQEFNPKRTLDVKVKERFQALKAESLALDGTIDGLHGVEAALLARIGELAKDETIGWLVANVIGAKKLPLALKLAVARTAGDRGDAMAAPLTKALAKATTSEELAVVLEGIVRCGKEARDGAPIVLKALEHEDAAVREQAAYALAALAVPEAIAPLIARMEVEEGATRRRIGSALEILTRQPLGDSARAWREWLAKEGADYVAGRKPLGGGRSTLAAALTAPADRKKPAYAYTIPKEGKSIVYVIDCSGSMVVSAKDPQHGAGGPVDAGPESRMEATKDALIEVLGQLGKENRFDLVCFNDLPHVYSPQMLAATPAEVRKAQQWVRALAASSTTNIHDALQEAFRLAGRGTRDKYYKSAVDTIFLLTDGSPTKNDNTPDSTERILAAVRSWNPTQHLVIHTIGVGKEINLPFLQQLAKENGGRFVQY